jgi:hypothetical protein
MILGATACVICHPDRPTLPFWPTGLAYRMPAERAIRAGS